MIQVGDKVIWVDQNNVGPFYGEKALGQVGTVIEWYGTGGQVEFTVNGMPQFWGCTDLEVALIGGGGVHTHNIHIDGQDIANQIGNLQYSIIDAAERSKVLLHEVSFQTEYYEVLLNREGISNTKIFEELEKKDNDCSLLTVGSIVMSISGGALKRSMRQVVLVRDVEGKEAVYFKEGLGKANKDQINHFKIKYNVTKDTGVTIEDLLILEGN